MDRKLATAFLTLILVLAILGLLAYSMFAPLFDQAFGPQPTLFPTEETAVPTTTPPAAGTPVPLTKSGIPLGTRLYLNQADVDSGKKPAATVETNDEVLSITSVGDNVWKVRFKGERLKQSGEYAYYFFRTLPPWDPDKAQKLETAKESPSQNGSNKSLTQSLEQMLDTSLPGGLLWGIYLAILIGAGSFFYFRILRRQIPNTLTSDSPIKALSRDNLPMIVVWGLRITPYAVGDEAARFQAQDGKNHKEKILAIKGTVEEYVSGLIVQVVKQYDAGSVNATLTSDHTLSVLSRRLNEKLGAQVGAMMEIYIVSVEANEEALEILRAPAAAKIESEADANRIRNLAESLGISIKDAANITYMQRLAQAATTWHNAMPMIGLNGQEALRRYSEEAREQTEG